MKISLSSLLAALAALLCAGGAGLARDGLWGTENLIADPKVEAGDIVTIVIPPAREASEVVRCPAQTAAARVVKRLPNGNLVLEAKVRLGRGYILIGGEAARADLGRGRGASRTVDISRVANLAVVTRRLDAEVVSALMRSLTRLNLRFASGSPVKGRRRRGSRFSK